MPCRHACRLRNAKRGACLGAIGTAPPGEVERIEDGRHLHRRDVIARPHPIDLDACSDDQTRRCPNGERPGEPFDRPVLHVAALKGGEYGPARQPAEQHAGVEARILVLLTQDGAAACTPQLAGQQPQRRREIRRHLAQRTVKWPEQPPQDTAILARLAAEPPVIENRPAGAIAGERREDADWRSRRQVRGADHAAGASRHDDNERADAAPPQRIGVVEEPSARHFAAESVERDADGVEEVLDHIAPRQQRHRWPRSRRGGR